MTRIFLKQDKWFANGYLCFTLLAVSAFLLFQVIPNGLSAPDDFLCWASFLAIPLIVWINLRVLTATIQKIKRDVKNSPR